MIKLNLFLSKKEIAVWSKNIKELRFDEETNSTKVIYVDDEWDKVSQTIDEIIKLIKKG